MWNILKLALAASFVCLCFYSCRLDGESNELTIASEKLNPTQLYKISNGIDTTIIGQLGTRIFIPKDAFIDMNGGKVKGQVDIQLKEIYKFSEMIRNGLSTTSDGKLLSTSGMIYLSASNMGQEVKLKDKGPLLISFKRASGNQSMRTYLGQKDSTGINWTLDTDNIYDTLYFSEMEDRIVPLAYGSDSVGPATINYGVIGVDTIELGRSYIYEGATSDLASGYSTDTAMLNDNSSNYYNIHTTKLEWINCDHFIDEQNLISVQVNTVEKADNQVYLIFKDYDAIMSSWEFQNKRRQFVNIPMGSAVTILGIYTENDQYFLAKKNSNLNKDKEQIDLKYKKVSLVQLEKQLNSLDK